MRPWIGILCRNSGTDRDLGNQPARRTDQTAKYASGAQMALPDDMARAVSKISRTDWIGGFPLGYNRFRQLTDKSEGQRRAIFALRPMKDSKSSHCVMRTKSRVSRS